HTLPNSSQTKRKNHSYITYAVNGPDGKLYIGGMFHDEMSVYDPDTDDLKTVGKFINSEEIWKDIPHHSYIGGMDFDHNGVLYYAVVTLREDFGEDYKLGSPLMRWDFKNNKEPEFLGLIGTKE